MLLSVNEINKALMNIQNERITEKKRVNAVSASVAEQKINGKAVQIKDNRPRSVIQQKQLDAIANWRPVYTTIQKKEDKTGLPGNLKSGIENLSSISMDDVKVYYPSDKPAQLNAHAYPQGTEIHIASGQEKHLPHEAWHVVQQKQGRVKPTIQMKGNVKINDDKGLEKEADVMGAKAFQFEDNRPEAVVQRKLQEMVSNRPLANPSLPSATQLKGDGKKSKHNRKARSSAKQSGLFYSLGEDVNPRRIERDLEEKNEVERDLEEKNEEPENDTKSAGEEVLELLVANGIDISLDILLKDFNELFVHLSTKMNLNVNDVLVSIGQSPEAFREFIRYTKPGVKIVNIQVSAVSEALEDAEAKAHKGVHINQDPIDVIAGDYEGADNFEEEYRTAAGEYLDLIYRNSGLAEHRGGTWWVIDYSNTGRTLKFFQKWFLKKTKQNVNIMKLNDEEFIKTRAQENTYLSLLNKKSDGPAQIILNALRLVKTKVDIRYLNKGQQPPSEDQATLKLLNRFVSEIAKYDNPK